MLSTRFAITGSDTAEKITGIWLSSVAVCIAPATGVAMGTMLVPVVEMLYSKDNISRKLGVPLIVILATGLIFSYCLFVPAIFAAICIYCFLKDFTIEGKTYFKFFKKTTI